MPPLDAFWHLLNFFGPAVGVGCFAVLLAKLVFRHELKRVGWFRLWLCAAVGAAVALVAGLVVFGHDGKMATYAALLAGSGLSLWWVGFRPLRR